MERITLTVDELAERLNRARDEGRMGALSEVHDVFVTVDDLPLGALPELTNRPLVRIVWRDVPGNPAAGVPDMAGWVLAQDQEGTLLPFLMRALVGEMRNRFGLP